MAIAIDFPFGERGDPRGGGSSPNAASDVAFGASSRMATASPATIASRPRAPQAMGVAGEDVTADYVDSLDLFHTMEAYFTWYPNGEGDFT